MRPWGLIRPYTVRRKVLPQGRQLGQVAHAHATVLIQRSLMRVCFRVVSAALHQSILAAALRMLGQ